MSCTIIYPDWVFLPPSVDYLENDERNTPTEGGRIVSIRYNVLYDGTPTKVFAYLGLPDGYREDGRVTGRTTPGILLVHGGAGSAYRDWVAEWVKRGYVALAPDLEGHEPLASADLCCWPKDLYVDSAYPAPRNQGYADAANPLPSTWMYYATSVAITGNSLLHSLGGVDPARVGVCGVSWGGVITSVITGYDKRFAFAIPIYCSLNNCGTVGRMADRLEQYPAARIWDNDRRLSKVKTPILLIASDADSSSDVVSISDTAWRCRHARLLFKHGFQHSQYLAVRLEEPYLFADAVLRGEGLTDTWLEVDCEHGVIHLDKNRITELTFFCTDRLAGTETVWSSFTHPVNPHGAVECIPAALLEPGRYIYAQAKLEDFEISSPVEKVPAR